MTLKMNSLLLCTLYFTAIILVTLFTVANSQQGNFNLRESPGPSRQVEVFVNVYDHPKTGFSCVGKQPGQYYADPATKCAVYYVCIPNPTGSMSPQSFACPNGTIFSQATRVCKPHEEVYCNLATRYYNSNKGKIDEKFAFDPLPLPVPVPDVPAVPATSFAHSTHSNSRRHHQSNPQKRTPQASQVAPAPQTPPKAAAPPPSPNTNLFNGGNSNRFRNSRTNNFANSQPSTSTTTPAAPAHKPPPAGPGALPGTGLSDYEYDYGDYTNETGNGANGGLSHAASSLHAAIIENIAEAIAKESKELAAASSAVVDTTARKTQPSESKTSTRRKRSSESVDEGSLPTAASPTSTSSWSMLNRRKGQLAEEKSLLSSFGERMLLEREEEEVDALAKDLLAQTAAANVVLSSAEVLPTTTLTTSSSSLSSSLNISFTCEDKVPGVAYADIDNGCSKFYICVTVAKGKQWSYHLACDEGLLFSQVLGTCETELAEGECAKSEQYYLYAKWHRPSKKHLLAEKKKRQMKKMLLKKDFE